MIAFQFSAHELGAAQRDISAAPSLPVLWEEQPTGSVVRLQMDPAPLNRFVGTSSIKRCLLVKLGIDQLAEKTPLKKVRASLASLQFSLPYDSEKLPNIV